MSELGGTGPYILEGIMQKGPVRNSGGPIYRTKHDRLVEVEIARKKRIKALDSFMALGNPFLLDRMEELRDELVDRVYLVKEISVPCGVCRGVGEFCSACMGTGRTGL
jgi:hypothetical protein